MINSSAELWRGENPHDFREVLMRPKRGAPTTRRPVLRKLVPEPLTPYDPNRPVETLTQLMERCLRGR
jgi:hypothetical protein